MTILGDTRHHKQLKVKMHCKEQRRIISEISYTKQVITIRH